MNAKLSPILNKQSQFPNEIDIDTWYAQMQSSWRQGEHVLILGPTGTGKTTVAHTILDIRDYVVVIAVKMKDDTLERFKHGHEYGRKIYKVIKKWPPDFPYHRIVLWLKPKSIKDTRWQSERLYIALDRMYLAGGWCIYFDETGYIVMMLGLGQAFGVLLNQGRSSGISVVAVMTRPTSIIAKVPKEALNQPRHKIIFKYDNRDEMKACAQIADVSMYEMQKYMDMLQYHGEKKFSDFLYCNQGKVIIVRSKEV